MIGSANIQSLLLKLNALLVKNKLSRTLIVMGGAAFFQLGEESRYTHDIDVADPAIDDVFQKIISQIGVENLIGDKWINSAGRVFTKKLPPGWQERAVPNQSLSNLKIKTLSREDLMKTKILAYFDRQSDSDLEDLKKLLPTTEDLGVCQSWLNSVRSQDETTQEIEKFFALLIKEIKNG